MTAETDEILRRITEEVRPKLHEESFRGGYDCCGCSTYAQIVDDIEAIVRSVSTPEETP